MNSSQVSPFKLYNRANKKRPKVVKNAPTLYVHFYQLIKEICLFDCFVCLLCKDLSNHGGLCTLYRWKALDE
jgi:hypothetical protein